MTNQPDEMTPDDQRRAAALMAHYGNTNIDGINAILAECDGDNGAATRLMLAVLDLTNQIMPAIYTRVGLQLLSRHILDMAKLDTERGGK